MSKQFSREEILNGLILDVADLLGIDVEDVTPDAPFFSRLQGESLDLLDLSFRIQKRFGIRASFRELLEGWKFAADGTIAADSVLHLSAAFPAIDWQSRFDAIQGQDPREAFTIELIAELLYQSQFAESKREAVAQNLN